MSAQIATRPSRASLFRHLALKDWSLNQWPLLAYTFCGLVSLFLITSQNKVIFHAGFVVLISAVIVFGAHLVFSCVINETNNKTLPFVLSLPMTFVEYSIGKMLFAIGSFMVLWLILIGGIFLVTNSQEHMMAGMLPYFLITMGYLFVAFVLTLSVAMIAESHVWAIVVMSICNISISIVMIAIAGIPSIGGSMGQASANWSPAVIGLLSGEALLTIGLLLGTIFIQSRKTEFL